MFIYTNQTTQLLPVNIFAGIALVKTCLVLDWINIAMEKLRKARKLGIYSGALLFDISPK